MDTNEEIVFKKPTVGGQQDTDADKRTNPPGDQTSTADMDSDQPKAQTVSKTVVPEPMTKLAPPDGHYFVDQLKNGVLIDHKAVNRPRLVFGRAQDCDVVLEHPSVSRYHAVLLWSPVSDDDFASGKNMDSFWYLVDCGSTHGTTCNKSQITAGKVIKLIPNNNVFKFGASTRLFSLGSTLDDNGQDADEVPLGNTSQVSIKKKETSIAEEDNGCSWGMADDADEEAGEETADSKSLQAIIAAMKSGTGGEGLQTDNSNAYSQNPTKCIQQWFEREGYDLDYKCDSLHNKFKCTIDLPVDGQWIPVEGSLMHKKKEAIADTCLKCCQLLDKAELLFPWQQQRRANRRRQEGEDNDSDGDMIDETVDLSKAKKFKKDNENSDSQTVDDFESLNKKWSDINEELRQLRVKMANMGTQRGGRQTDEDVSADPLDSYMASMGQKKYGLSMNDKIEKSKLRMKVNVLEKEQQKLEKLIKLAKPSVKFDDPTPMPNSATNEVQTATTTEPIKEKPLSVTTTQKSDEVRADVKSDESAEIAKKEEIKRKTEAILNDLKMSSKPKPESKGPKQKPKAQSIVEAIEREKKSEKTKVENQYDSDYVDWLPPTDQSGDGKTSLNQKLGY